MISNRDARALLSILLADTFPIAPSEYEAAKEWTAEKQQAAHALVWRDLTARSPQLSTIFTRLDDRADPQPAGSAQDASENAGGAATEEGDAAASVAASGRRKFDVVVLCPLPHEFLATLIAFGIDPTSAEDENLGGHKIYFTAIERPKPREDLRVAIAVIMRPRNVAAALMVGKLAARYAPEAMFLCGIGAGVKGKIDLGDVVASTRVLDVAGGRRQTEKVIPRPDPVPLPGEALNQIGYLVQGGFNLAQWRRDAIAALGRVAALERLQMPKQADIDAARFGLTGGCIVAGEQLVADGSLPKHLESDDRIRSCDMEGSGFGQGCNDRNLNWSIFRGISDFGDPDKADAWQAAAACTAGLATRMFLESEFRLRSEILEVDF